MKPVYSRGRLFQRPIFRPAQLHDRKFIIYLESVGISKVVGTGSDIRLQEHKNQLTNLLVMIIRSTTKRIYYPAPEKQRTLIHGSRRIRYLHAALLVQPKS